MPEGFLFNHFYYWLSLNPSGTFVTFFNPLTPNIGVRSECVSLKLTLESEHRGAVHNHETLSAIAFCNQRHDSAVRLQITRIDVHIISARTPSDPVTGLSNCQLEGDMFDAGGTHIDFVATRELTACIISFPIGAGQPEFNIGGCRAVFISDADNFIDW